MSTEENTSGMGKDHELPPGVKGWSWGAFQFNWIWACFNKTWFGLLALIPLVGIIVSFYLGFKGRELAWQNKRWDSLEHFNRVQRRWSAWGVGLLVIGLIGIVAAIALPAYQDYVNKNKAVEAAAQQEADLNRLLLESATTINRDLPKMLDAETRFDSTSGEGRRFTYYYTLIAASVDEIDKAYFESVMKPKLVSGVCSSEEMKALIGNSIPVIFAYRDRDGKDFIQLAVETERCGDPEYVNAGPKTVGDSEGSYTVDRPEGWIDEASLVPGADFALSHPQQEYYFFARKSADGAANIVDAINVEGINLSLKLENASASQCTLPEVREDNTAYCEIIVKGCSGETCLAYLVTAMKRDNRMVILGGWSEQSRHEAFIPIYRQILASFHWPAPPALEPSLEAAPLDEGLEIAPLPE